MSSPYYEFINGGNPTGGINIKPNECAPTVGKTKDVCSSKEALEIMKSYLQTHNIQITNDPKVIVHQAKKITGCQSESCLYSKDLGLSKKELRENFAEPGPWNNKNWLSNDDIDKALDKYTKAIPQLHHVTFHMSDFHKHDTPLTTMNWDSIILDMPDKKYISCVLNTDVTGGPGQHWVAFFIDLENETIEFFDSAGSAPWESMHEFMITTMERLNAGNKGKNFKTVLVCEDIVHQKENTECGVYSLYYIISRINGVGFKYFQNNVVSDNVMIGFRKMLFRHS